MKGSERNAKRTAKHDMSRTTTDEQVLLFLCPFFEGVVAGAVVVVATDGWRASSIVEAFDLKDSAVDVGH